MAMQFSNDQIYAVYQHLIEKASSPRDDSFALYDDIADFLGIPKHYGHEKGRLLGEVMKRLNDHDRSFDSTRPMLSSVVIKADGTPGTGFYGLALSYGYAVPDQDDKKGQIEFWRGELARVREYWRSQAANAALPTIPTETDPTIYMEGARVQVVSHQYERNRDARERCLEHYGYSCSVCGFDFEKVYGDIGHGVIEVHHLTPISANGQIHAVDPIRDLRPVCPNCHTMLHTRTAPSIEELKARLTAVPRS